MSTTSTMSMVSTINVLLPIHNHITPNYIKLDYMSLCNTLGRQLQGQYSDMNVVLWNHGNGMIECVIYPISKSDLGKYKLKYANFQDKVFILTGISSSIAVFKKELAIQLSSSQIDKDYLINEYIMDADA